MRITILLYVAHARRIDRELGAPGSTQIEQRLRSYTETRGRSARTERHQPSADVHDIISAAAEAIAKRQWRLETSRRMLAD